MLFVACLWYSNLDKIFIPLLIAAWLLDGGLSRLMVLLRQPLVQAILVLCVLLLIGLFWSDAPDEGRHKWRKYFFLLLYPPFLGLLTKQRLPWVIAAVIAGYCVVLFAGVFEWYFGQQQGIPILGISYLGFSAMLGIGAILSGYGACVSNKTGLRVVFAVLALLLLYLQFHQSARGVLLATLAAQTVLIIVYMQASWRQFVGIALSILAIIALLAYSSPVHQDRWLQAKQDYEKIIAGDFSSSIGYRLAIWDVGIQGILERPLQGHGSGMPATYFDAKIVDYKNGVYQDLPKFQPTVHYHNDWIEIGMHLGALGLLALCFLQWAWYKTFAREKLLLLGKTLLVFILVAGLTEVLMIFYRIPLFLLVITALMVC